MAKKKFTVFELLELNLQGYDALELRCIGGKSGLMRKIAVLDINRPGLALSGFFDSFMSNRMQIFGRGETAYIQKLGDEKNDSSLGMFFSYTTIPCCIFSSNREPTQRFYQLAEESCCPILQTSLETADFSTRLIRVLSNIFAPRKTIHGVLMEVYGVGVFLHGKATIGKSETALELIERGHRLIADDLVEVRCVHGNSIIGRGVNSFMCHYMEIRGIGIINVAQLYGMGSILDKREIELVIELEEWDPEREYDRLGVDSLFARVLGVLIPKRLVPVKSGRNLPIIIEAACMNERLKKMGENSAKKFCQNVLKWTENDNSESDEMMDVMNYIKK